MADRTHLTETPTHPATTGLTDIPFQTNVDGDLKRIGRLELRGEIARGGMGVVYRAHDPNIGREVAVKVLGERLSRRPDAVRRFLEEARVTGQLQHPSVPPVFEVGELTDGRPYLAMKLVNGETLATLLARRKKLSEEHSRFVTVFKQVCQAVAYAHSRNVIHRDLKPQNVMVGLFGEVQVMDWGLAKTVVQRRPEAGAIADVHSTEPNADASPESADALTRTGTVLGTPAFMPPEQARGEVARIGRRADVFGLGAILCVILTGRAPYVGKSLHDVRNLAVTGNLSGAYERLDNCGAEHDLVSLCKRCLSAEPTDRPKDAKEVVTALVGLRVAAEALGRRREATRHALHALEKEKRRRIELETDVMLVIRMFLQLESCGVDPEVVSLALRCVSANPSERFHSLSEQSAAIEAYRAKVKALKKKPAPLNIAKKDEVEPPLPYPIRGRVAKDNPQKNQ